MDSVSANEFGTGVFQEDLKGAYIRTHADRVLDAWFVEVAKQKDAGEEHRKKNSE